jgi:long-chain acyl-CoA synthetase
MSAAVSFNNIVEMFINLTDKFAHVEKPMLMRKKDGAYRPMTYREVRTLVEEFYHGLISIGIKRGERIAILSENRPEWVISDMAILALGGLDVPLYPSQTGKQIEYILKDAGVTGIIVSNQFQLTKVLKIRSEVPVLKHIIVMNELSANILDGARTFTSILEEGREEAKNKPDAMRSNVARIGLSDHCTIIYTSGTTGNPKGVVLSHGNFASNVKGALDVVPINPTDIMLSFLPLSHVFERTAGYYAAMGGGATIAYAESIDTVSDNMSEVRPTIMCCVPRLFERIYSRLARMIEKDPPIKRRIFYWAVDTGRKFLAAQTERRMPVLLAAQHALADKLVYSTIREKTGGRIRFFISGGAALPRELGEFFEAIGLLVLEGYGLTESSPVIAVNRIGNHKFGSVGHPFPGVEVMIAEDGEILTRGPHVMVGYYNNKKATEEAIDKNGWLHTGDIGMLDDHGRLYITDRKKHLFVSSGGKNIAPQPIENLFAGNEVIDQFVLIGDRRMFLSALIYPNYDVLKEYADRNGIPYRTVSDLAKNPEIYEMIEQRIQATQKDMPNYERVRRFALLEQPLSIENGELTPSLKVRRKTVEERYGDLIESMYKSAI